MSESALSMAIESVPAGAWAVGVSGGADSVALLLLLHRRIDLRLRVVHLDHETRGADSTADAQFVADLAARLGLQCTIAQRSAVEATMSRLPANTSSRYRSARIALFRRAVVEHDLAGVILAHHANDRAETVLQRLLRGSGPMGLAPLEPATELGDLKILRPLLGVGRDELRAVLTEAGQPWREDASNASDAYQRNRLRRMLAEEPALAEALLEAGSGCSALRDWAHRAAPTLGPTFPASALAGLPSILAAESARRWLIARGAPPEKLQPHVIDRLISLAADAGTGPRISFPGDLQVYRRQGMVGIE